MSDVCHKFSLPSSKRKLICKFYNTTMCLICIIKKKLGLNVTRFPPTIIAYENISVSKG